MATQSPFSFLRNALAELGKTLSPPQWLVHEVQHRMVLLVNHVLQQEPEAMRRLATQQGKSVYVSWRQFHLQVRLTPAGLLDLDENHGANDLLLEIAEKSVTQLAKTAMQGEKPPIRIAGDVHLASELNWVIDNVRWDLEEDLARLIGDVPAHKVAQVARKVANELRRFVQSATSAASGLARKPDQPGSDSQGGGPAAAPAASSEPPRPNHPHDAP
ncbi:hypothetical protein D8I35_11595 [Corticibacter populi]|uniref:Ubiquinone biosynthesis protein UbiJ n=1 Tax=Corticibacter populi TaxID=1550736 RepID=A0A3M6QRY6_9BURK|nr:hypothetical protein [Corticibacter populi]RMX05798.1 hypothetical protein D8I35_11595 [Corticibacter populi]RZS30892.1 ubiquinone biosynthesis protein UbiJ [Corticibacter populi]